MDVTLRPDLQAVVDEEVKSGRFTDSSEFLNRAVEHYLGTRDLGEEYTCDEIDQMIDEGIADFERGDTIDGEEAFRMLRAHSLERRQRG